MVTLSLSNSDYAILRHAVRMAIEWEISCADAHHNSLHHDDIKSASVHRKTERQLKLLWTRHFQKLAAKKREPKLYYWYLNEGYGFSVWRAANRLRLREYLAENGEDLRG